MNVARDIVGDDFRISFPEREMLAYWEGEDGYLFHGGWGMTPPVVAVPSAEAWPGVTPPWLHGKGDLVLARLHEDAGHAVQESADADWQYRLNPQNRILKSRL